MSGSSAHRPKVNLRSTAVKRIMQEASKSSNPEEDDFVAAPLETDIFEWHCTVRGVPGSEYQGGPPLLPYPILSLMRNRDRAVPPPDPPPPKLPHVRTRHHPPNPKRAVRARQEGLSPTPSPTRSIADGEQICIDGLTSFHAGSWQPAWGVRTAITGLRSFWMQSGEALSAIGALDYSKEERRRLAKLSREWKCPNCALPNHELMRGKTGSSSAGNEEKEVAQPRTPGSEETVVATPSEAEPSETMVPGLSPLAQEEIPATPSSPVIQNTAPSPLATRPAPRPAVQSRPIPWFAPRRSHEPPLWIDLCLAFLISILSLLIYKRIA